MANNISIWALIANADIIVKLVILMLLVVSIWSWSLIFKRASLLAQTKKRFKAFEADFWSGNDISKLYKKPAKGKTLFGIDAIFSSGYKTFFKLKETSMSKAKTLEEVDRSLKVALSREADRLESSLSVLATIGSVSPYVGLFGTVWGIMHAFIALGSVEQATLSMVAPGISEALIATAMGLVVAIPASIAYNTFISLAELQLNEYENFDEELLGILSRQLHTGQDNAPEEG